MAQWGFIVNGTNARPGALHLSENAVLRWPYKLVTGKQVYSVWQGALYPNCTTVDSALHDKGPMFTDTKLFNEVIEFAYLTKNQDRLTWTYDCKDGCLVNVEADPNEHENLADDPAFSHMKETLKETLADLNKGLFEPERGQPQLAACTTGLKSGGYLGPFAFADDWYSPVHLSIAKKVKNALLKKVLESVNQPEYEKKAVRTGRLIVPPIRSVFQKGPAADKCLSNSSSQALSEDIV